jgi:hypothetical protein
MQIVSSVLKCFACLIGLFQSIAFEGWLKKKGERNPMWKKRYFMLVDQELLYFTDKPAVRSPPQGKINLQVILFLFLSLLSFQPSANYIDSCLTAIGSDMDSSFSSFRTRIMAF